MNNHPTSLPVDTMEAGADLISAQVIDRKTVSATVRALSSVNGCRSASIILLQWSVILAAIAIAGFANKWLIYVFACVCIASRQHALGVLMHDAAHYRLFTNRRVNDFVSNVFLAFPLGVSTSLYRRNHLAHHRYVNDAERDPDFVCVVDDSDWEWPKSCTHCKMLFLRDLTGLSVVRLSHVIWYRWSPWPYLFTPVAKGPDWSERLFLLSWVACVASALIFLNAWWLFLGLWVLPASTMLTAIFRVRSLAEHYCVERVNELNHTRTVLPSYWERWLLSPLNVNFHLEHHLFPTVPFFNLPKLHAELMQLPEFRAHAHITLTYLGCVRGLMAELTSRSRQVDS